MQQNTTLESQNGPISLLQDSCFLTKLQHLPLEHEIGSLCESDELTHCAQLIEEIQLEKDKLSIQSPLHSPFSPHHPQQQSLPLEKSPERDLEAATACTNDCQTGAVNRKATFWTNRLVAISVLVVSTIACVVVLVVSGVIITTKTI